MLGTTERRPAPLPDHGQAGLHPASVPSSPTVTPPPAAVTPGDGRLPQGATHWSKAFYDPQGLRHTARHVVPVNKNGQVVAQAYECDRCGARGWFQLGLKQPPICSVCRATMRLPLVRSRVGEALADLPWVPMWKTVDRPLRAVWVGAAVAAAGSVATTAAAPGWLLTASALPAGLAAHRLAGWKWRRDAGNGGADAADLDDDKRAGKTITRRARAVGYCTAAACGWTALATTTGLDPHTAGGDLSLTLLAAAWLYPAATWWRWLRGQRRIAAPVETVATMDVVDVSVDPYEVEVVATWATRVAATNGILPNTHLTGFRYIKGGWAATVVSDTPGSVAPERWHSAAGRVAGAYRCGIQDVSLELDGSDASQATVL